MLESALKDAALIDLCLGSDETGTNVYVYLKIKLDRYTAYTQTALSGEDFNPEDFGEIIAQGKGTPPLALQQELKKEYGFWDEFEEKMEEFGHTVLDAYAKGERA